MTTSAIPLAEAWTIYATTTPPALIDAIEENAVDLGLVDGTDEFYVECLGQLAAELGR